MAQNASDTNATNAGYAVVARAANSRSWANLAFQTNQAGKVTTTTNSAYTEIAANLCAQDANGVWSDSDGGLAIVADGASSGNSPLAVHFAGDANTAGGAIQLTAPDGKVFLSKVYGLSYYDPTLNTNVLIASLQSSQGQLVGNNHVVYQNAFTGLNADLWYTYSPSGGLDQDIVLHDCPPSPAAYGLNPQTTRLQVFTEWFNPPQPRITTAEDDGITHDAYLDFGNMVMGPGAALFTQGQADPAPVESGSIYKHWQQISGRNWLVEEIRYPIIANLLQTLPLHASAVKPGKNLFEDIASTQPLRPKTGDAEPGKPVQVAKNLPHQAGLVLDYSIASSVANYTFQGDTTYYVSTNVTMTGTNTTFEGGAVLKYASNVTMTVNSPVTWLAGSYRPVIMTAKDDNSMGGTISGSTGSPGSKYYAATALNYNGSTANTNLVLQHLRVLNAQTAVAINGETNHVLSSVQMVNCGNGLAATNATFSLWNGLMYNVMTNFTGTNSTGDVEHLTVDTANWLNTNQTLSLTNCLLVSVTNAGSFTSNSTYSAVSGSGVFAKVGGGWHYLATNSPYLGAGTTNINPALAQALSGMTTFPPLLESGYITTLTVWSPEVPRDAGVPAAGYHYDCLDFAGTNLNVWTTTLTLTNGVALGVLGSAGLSVYGTLVSQGTPVNLNHLASGATVQEMPTPAVTNLIGGNGTWLGLNFRFTELPTLGGATTFLDVDDSSAQVTAGPLTLRDCLLHGGQVYVALGAFSDGFGDQSAMTLNLTNNLLDRCAVTFYRGNSYTGGNPSVLAVNSYNNLFHAGALHIWYFLNSGDNMPWSGPPQPPSWYFYDNLFENLNLDERGGDPINGMIWPSYVVNGYNGYVNTTSIQSSAGGDKTPTTADYQIAALGNFYYPTNGGNLSTLIHAGSTSAANVGLYHYTVTTNNVVEGTNTVSIGFHYIAVDANGNPLDTNGNGIPDYLDDINGNGIFDAGDLGNWMPYVPDTGGLIGLQIYTPMQ